MQERREYANERRCHLEDENELGPAQLPVVPSGSSLFDNCLDEKEQRISLYFLSGFLVALDFMFFDVLLLL